MPSSTTHSHPHNPPQAWLRSRGEAGGSAVLTAAGVAERFGVAPGTFRPVAIEQRDVLHVRPAARCSYDASVTRRGATSR